MVKWVLTILFLLFFDLNLFSKNYIFNLTKIDDSDYFVSLGLEYYKIDSVVVTIKPLTNNDEFEAYVDHKDNQYIIWINEKTTEGYFKILSHELIHIKQYFYDELIIDGLYVIWLGEFFEYEFLDYEDRPWENEAYENSYELMSIIKELF